MADLTTYPIEDWYESKLSQPYDWTSSTIYVDSIPTATLPSGQKVLVTINPGTTYAQTVEVSGRTTGQLTVSSTTVEKANGVNYTTRTHGAKSPIIISDNFAYWEAIANAVNSKSDKASPVFTWSVGLPTYANATARDTAIPSPTQAMMVKTNNVVQHYNSATAQWEDLDVGTPVPNASTTVAGKVEKATPTEVTNGTSTGWTGAELFVWPAELKTVTDSINTSLWTIWWISATLWEPLTAWNVVSNDTDTGKVIRTYWQWVSATVFNTTAAAKVFDYAIALSSTTTIYYTWYQIAWWYSKFSISAWTVSWNTLSIWSSYELWGYGASSGIQFWWITQLDTNKFIVIYAVNYNSANRIYAKACTVSWNTITLWAETELMNTASALTWWSVTMVDTNKFVINYAYWSANKLMTWTVSWTTITMWWEQTWFAFLSTAWAYVSADKIALTDWSNIRLYTFSWYIATQWNNLAIWTTYTNYSLKDIGSSKSIFCGTNSSNSFAFIVDNSWATPSKWTTVTVLAASTTNDCCKVNNNQVCIVTGSNKYYFYNYSGTTLSFENNFTWTYNISAFNSINYLASWMLVWIYWSWLTSLWHVVSNRIHNILWILQSSWVLNDVKAVKISWWLSSIHTWLQPGRNIYLNNDWTLVYESWTFLWKTQSSTSLLVWINYSAL